MRQERQFFWEVSIFIVAAINIGIMGGTFNPIHYGHLMIAEEARQQLQLAKVIFMPSYRTPHKEMVGPTARQRWEMTRLATADNPYFYVSDWEIRRRGASYTIETLRYFRDKWGEQVTLFFISGTDTVHDLIHWKKPYEILSACYVVGALRPDGSENITASVQQFGALGKKIIKLPVPTMASSSTLIRKRLQEGQSIRYLVPLTVQKYIEKNGVYACLEKQIK